MQTTDWGGNPHRPAALNIGAGIAGIQAALDVADAGYLVFLVEREPSIGGRTPQLDKTFPTLDCSWCILTPKMVDVRGLGDLPEWSRRRQLSGGSWRGSTRCRAERSILRQTWWYWRWAWSPAPTSPTSPPCSNRRAPPMVSCWSTIPNCVRWTHLWMVLVSWLLPGAQGYLGYHRPGEGRRLLCAGSPHSRHGAMGGRHSRSRGGSVHWVRDLRGGMSIRRASPRPPSGRSVGSMTYCAKDAGRVQKLSLEGYSVAAPHPGASAGAGGCADVIAGAVAALGRGPNDQGCALMGPNLSQRRALQWLVTLRGRHG